MNLHIGTELRQLLVSGRGNGLLFRLAEEIGVERSDQIRNLKAYLEATQGVLMGKLMTGYDYIDLAANKHDAHFPPTDDAGHDFLSSVVIGGRWRGSTRLVYDLARWTVTLCDWLAEGNGEEIVVFSTENGPTAAAYIANAGDGELSFSHEEGHYRDAQTGSLWNLSGVAVSGPLQGATLEPLPGRYTFWFAYIAAFPDADVYAP